MHSLSRYFNTFLVFSFVLLIASCNEGNQNKLNKDLIGYWQLIEDTKDRSGNNLQTKIHRLIKFNFEGPSRKQGAAKFNGKDAWLEVLFTHGLHVSDEDFSITAWIHTEDKLDDVLGDIFSKYDRTSKRGYQLSLKNDATTTSHSNYRQLKKIDAHPHFALTSIQVLNGG